MAPEIAMMMAKHRLPGEQHNRLHAMLDRTDRLVTVFADRTNDEFRRRRFNGSRYVRLCFAHKRAVALQERVEILAINLIYGRTKLPR